LIASLARHGERFRHIHRTPANSTEPTSNIYDLIPMRLVEYPHLPLTSLSGPAQLISSPLDAARGEAEDEK
jgi:hypothetical protein